MMNLFKKLFATRRKPHSVGRTFRPTLESLEAREVPSAGWGFGGAREAALFSQAQFGPAFAGATGWLNDHGHGWAAGSQASTLAASLTGTGGASGSVTVSTNAATGNESLSLHASGLTPDTTYTVASGTTTLGTFKTNGDGRGRLFVSDVSPALTATSVITVTDLSTVTNPSGTPALTGTLGATHLLATLGGASGGDGVASYQANVFTGTNSLQVSLFGLSAGTYTVELNGTTVGSPITITANGQGHLSVSGLATPPTATTVLTILDSNGATVLTGSFSQAPFGRSFAGATGWLNDHGGGWAAGSQASTLAASLTGTGSGSVTVSTNAATGNESLSLHASGLTPDTTYTVASGTTTLGTFTTNGDGRGRLFVHDVSPALTAASGITVTPNSSGTPALTGTLGATHLLATLGGASGGDGVASYQANVFTGTNSLQVSLFGLSTNATYTVDLNGTPLVGSTITTDANGRGHLSLSGLATPPTATTVLTILDSNGATVLTGSFTTSGFGWFGGGFLYSGNTYHHMANAEAYWNQGW